MIRFGRYIGSVLAGVFLFLPLAHAGSAIKVNIDFSEGRYVSRLTGSGKSVVIDAITVNRTLPADVDEPGEISPKYTNNQIGWLKNGVWEYEIILNKMTIEEFVRDAVTLAFEKSGYEVLTAGKDATDAQHVSVDVSELWTWVSPIEGTAQRKQFNFAMTTNVISNTEGVADIGPVRVVDYRNGTRVDSGKSYRNTIMYSMKSYIEVFAAAVTAANTTTMGESPQQTSGAGATAELATRLEQLNELRESGVISDEEYAELRKKTLADY